jgi:predicted nucleotidyltransferase
MGGLRTRPLARPCIDPSILGDVRFAMGSAANSKGEIVEKAREAEPEIRSLGVRRLALFGSFVRGEAGAASDVDVLVEFEPDRKTFDSFLALGDLLERLWHRRVELVTTEALSPHIGPRILAEAEDVLRSA